MSLDPLFLDLLVCPVTRTRLRFVADPEAPDGGLLVSEAAGLAFPVEDGIPVMLLEEARPWPPEGEG